MGLFSVFNFSSSSRQNGSCFLPVHREERRSWPPSERTARWSPLPPACRRQLWGPTPGRSPAGNYQAERLRPSGLLCPRRRPANPARGLPAAGGPRAEPGAEAAGSACRGPHPAPPRRSGPAPFPPSSAGNGRGPARRTCPGALRACSSPPPASASPLGCRGPAPGPLRTGPATEGGGRGPASSSQSCGRDGTAGVLLALCVTGRTVLVNCVHLRTARLGG